MWIFDCIVLTSTVARASVHFRTSISFSKFFVMSSGMDSSLLSYLLFHVEFVRPSTTRSRGLVWDGEFICACWSVRIWVSCYKCCKACCLITWCLHVRWKKIEQKIRKSACTWDNIASKLMIGSTGGGMVMIFEVDTTIIIREYVNTNEIEWKMSMFAISEA